MSPIENIDHGDPFDIYGAVEQQPYFSSHTAERQFLENWFRVNDSIVPLFSTREEMVKIGRGDHSGMLHEIKDPEYAGKKVLFIAEDMSLWEMLEVMSLVDNDTFKDRPEVAEEKKEEILKMGRLLRNAGIYIAERIDAIEDGKPIAEFMATKLYEYGNSVLIGKRYPTEEHNELEEIRGKHLTDEETAEVERWLAGDELYKSRMDRAARFGGDVLDKESVRRETLKQFFRVSQMAVVLNERKDLKKSDKKLVGFDEQRQPIFVDRQFMDLDTAAHEAFVNDLRQAIKTEIEAPKTGLEDAAFRRGVSMLKEGMGIKSIKDQLANLGHQIENEHQTLYEVLQVDKLKEELRQVREQGNLVDISEKEIQIAAIIQKAVSQYKYDETRYNPSAIIPSESLNCVGFSMLGSALQSEVGLKCFAASIPGHSITVLATSDGRLFWQDMQHQFVTEILDEDIEVKGGKVKAVKEIAQLRQEDLSDNITFTLNNSKFDSFFTTRTGETLDVSLLPVIDGVELQVLINLSNELDNNDKYTAALEAAEKAETLGLRHKYVYANLAFLHYEMNNIEKSKFYVRKTLDLDDKFAEPYNTMALINLKQGNLRIAEELFNEALQRNPEDKRIVRNLGQCYEASGNNEKALETYQKAINMDPDFLRARLDLATLLIKTGDIGKAKTELDEVLKRANPAKASKSIARAKQLLQSLEDQDFSI